MKVGILHDDKKIEKIAQEVAENQFTGMGGLTGTIYEEFGIAIAKKYANSLFEVDFNYVGTYMKLHELQENKELMGLFLFKEYLKHAIEGFAGIGNAQEFIKSFQNDIENHFEKMGKEKTIEIQNLVSDSVKNIREKLSGYLSESCNQVNNMIEGFIIQS